jgi:hypothetical protein
VEVERRVEWGVGKRSCAGGPFIGRGGQRAGDGRRPRPTSARGMTSPWWGRGDVCVVASAKGESPSIGEGRLSGALLVVRGKTSWACTTSPGARVSTGGLATCPWAELDREGGSGRSKRDGVRARLMWA